MFQCNLTTSFATKFAKEGLIYSSFFLYRPTTLKVFGNKEKGHLTYYVIHRESRTATTARECSGKNETGQEMSYQ